MPAKQQNQRQPHYTGSLTSPPRRYFNERLSWKDHVHDLINKSSKKIGLLRRLGRQLSSTVVRDLYTFSIRPGIEYGSIFWSGLSSSEAARLERLNRSAARLITKTSPTSDISRELLLARAALPSLGTRRRMAQCTLLFEKLILDAILVPFSKLFRYGYRLASGENYHGQVHFSFMFSTQTNPSSNVHHSFKQPPAGTDLLPLQPAETSFRPGAFQTFLSNNSVHMLFVIINFSHTRTYI